MVSVYSRLAGVGFLATTAASLANRPRSAKPGGIGDGCSCPPLEARERGDWTGIESLLVTIGRSFTLLGSIPLAKFCFRSLNTLTVICEDDVDGCGGFANGDARLRELILHRRHGQGLLTVMNHSSTLDDPGLVGALLPWDLILSPSKVRWSLCEQAYFDVNMFLSMFMGAGKAVPIQRQQIKERGEEGEEDNRLRQSEGGGGEGKVASTSGGVFQSTMDWMITALRAPFGEWVHIFPEGRIWQEISNRRSTVDGCWLSASGRRGASNRVQNHRTGNNTSCSTTRGHLGPLKRGVGRLVVESHPDWPTREMARSKVNLQKDKNISNSIFSNRGCGSASGPGSAPAIVVPLFHIGMTNVMPFKADNHNKHLLLRTGNHVLVIVGRAIECDDIVKPAAMQRRQLAAAGAAAHDLIKFDLAVFDAVTERIAKRLAELEAHGEAYIAVNGLDIPRQQQSQLPRGLHRPVTTVLNHQNAGLRRLEE